MGVIQARFGAAGYNGGMDFTCGQQSGNSSWIYWNQWIDKAPGYSGPWGTSGTASAYTPGCGPCNGNAGGDFTAGGTGGHRFVVNSGGTWVGHDGNGDLYVTYGSVITNSYMGTSHPADGGEWAARIPEAPGQVPWVGNFTNVTPTSVTFSWGAAGRGHGDIDAYLWRILNAAGNQELYRIQGGVFYSDDTADNYTLTPGTTYLFQVQAHNRDGWGAWSPTASVQTIVSTPPGIVISPSPSGRSATLTMTSPGGVSGVNRYDIEQRLGSAGAVTKYSTTTNTYTVDGLTPGATYEWRVSALVGTYQSPWSAWTPQQQPNPSTSPGDYFDGSTAATPDQTYAWTGTANASTSQALGKGVEGWLAFGAAGAAGATGAVARVSDPRVPGGQSFGARVTFFSDAMTPGFVAGTVATATQGADVTEAATYTGSIYVKPSRPQLLAARIQWTKMDGTTGISASNGTPVLAPAGVWTRLVVTDVAPPLSEWAGVRAIDVTGAGWSFWKGGETLVLDGAMLSLGAYATDYFDGSFAATSTYAYEWVDPDKPNASPSTRTKSEEDPADLLLDPSCPPVPSAPRPPTVLDSCITETGVWRRYFAEIGGQEVPDWSSVLPTFTLKTKGVAEQQVRIRVYPNPFGYSVDQVDTSNWCSEQIISYMPANSTFTLDAEIQRVFADVAGGHGSLSADHLLYGSGGTPASWPELSCGTTYLVSFDTALEAPAGNLGYEITLTRKL